MEHLAQIALLVHDYDEAISYYTQVLSFELLEDSPSTAGDGSPKRWVVVKPKNGECKILLAKAASEHQKQWVGNQAGGRVFLFLHTTDIDAFYTRLQAHSVEIVRPLSEQEYGKVLVFKDLYGNLWDLIQPAQS